MDSKNPSAFPLLVPASLNVNQQQQAIIEEQMQKYAGMSLLDYFAAKIAPVLVGGLGIRYPSEPTCATVALTAYDVATAMMAERERRLNKSQQSLE